MFYETTAGEVTPSGGEPLIQEIFVIELLKELMISGMNVARIKFSHGTHEEKQILIDVFKKVREELGLPIAFLIYKRTKSKNRKTKKWKY